MLPILLVQKETQNVRIQRTSLAFSIEPWMCIHTYKYYWEKMNLAFRLGLPLLKIDQNWEVWPPKLPVHKSGVSVFYMLWVWSKQNILILKENCSLYSLPSVLPTNKNIFPWLNKLLSYFHLLITVSSITYIWEYSIIFSYENILILIVELNHVCKVQLLEVVVM